MEGRSRLNVASAGRAAKTTEDHRTLVVTCDITNFNYLNYLVLHVTERARLIKCSKRSTSVTHGTLPIPRIHLSIPAPLPLPAVTLHAPGHITNCIHPTAFYKKCAPFENKEIHLYHRRIPSCQLQNIYIFIYSNMAFSYALVTFQQPTFMVLSWADLLNISGKSLY